MQNTQLELEQQVNSIARYVEDITENKLWIRAKHITDDTTIYSTKDMIAKVIYKVTAEEFLDIIKPAIHLVKELDEWVIQQAGSQADGTLANKQQAELVQNVRDYVIALDEDSIEDDEFVSEITSLLVAADEIEQATLDDYFDDNHGIEFRVDQNLNIMGVKVCVACGGPAIYVCSNRGVWGVWGSKTAECDLTVEAKIAIDDWGESTFEIIQARHTDGFSSPIW